MQQPTAPRAYRIAACPDGSRPNVRAGRCRRRCAVVLVRLDGGFPALTCDFVFVPTGLEPAHPRNRDGASDVDDLMPYGLRHGSRTYLHRLP